MGSVGRDRRVLTFQFSNFDRAEVSVGGLRFPTVEHAYQACKTNDTLWKKEIQSARTPAQAKQLGRRAPMRSDWEDIKYSTMVFLLRQKFAYGTFRWQRLMDTGTDQIVEWNDWHDNIWGICVCSKCSGDGENLLGKALMQIRQEWAEKKSAGSTAGSSTTSSEDVAVGSSGGSPVQND